LQTSHARLTTAVIKNRQASGPHGYAPDAKIFSANSRDLKALNWAIVSKNCRVINQSFHRPSEQTTATMSFDDLAKDYYATRYPYPTIVQAAGNQPSANTEFVNHKGFNGIVVGNHDDARAVDAADVGLPQPDVLPPGSRAARHLRQWRHVTAVGLTMGGRASPRRRWPDQSRWFSTRPTRSSTGRRGACDRGWRRRGATCSAARVGRRQPSCRWQGRRRRPRHA
jgi:hypothetical protein